LWNIHEESFFNTLKPVLSHAALKVSYSLTADRGPGFVTNSLAVIKSESLWRPGVNETALVLEDLENNELTYEKKHELNIGVDVGFLNNRINFSADWYQRNNFDLIGPTITRGVGGDLEKYANVATMKSHGLEFTLTTKNIATEDFDWTTSFIFSFNNTEITELMSNRSVMSLISGTGFGKQGYSYRALFSIPFRGLTEDGFPTFINQDGELTVTDLNFSSLNTDFLKYEGPTEPTHFGSLGNIFRYKGFKLNVFVTYSFGNKVRLDPVFRAYYSDMRSMPKEFKNRWTLPGDEVYTNIPVIAGYRQYRDNTQLYYAYSAYNYSDERIADGSFIRLKELSLSYDFPSLWISRLGFKSISAKIQATNLFLLYADSKLNGQDPEFFRSGGVSLPVPKQITMTLKLGL
jgi:hypothetical protein